MPESGETAIARLRKAVIAQKTASLPDPPKDRLLQPFYDQLFEYDQYITQTVINILQGASDAKDYTHREQIDKLKGELENPLNPATKRELDLYNNYLLRLDKMMVLVKAVISERAIKKE